ncbi:MAG: anthranilate synthase component [Halanaerobiales bacterium]|nr:anthranilate synthase component [Halanaerobiales bacterium]
MMRLEEFLELSGEYNLIPLYDEIVGDTETPVTLYNRLGKENDYSYLLESAGAGRYSFIGLFPEKVFKRTKKGILFLDSKGEGTELVQDRTNLIEFLKDYLKGLKTYQAENLPPFSGGLVGYFAYEMIEEWEDLFHNEEGRKIQHGDLPTSILVIAGVIIAIDHFTHTIKIITNVKIDQGLTEEERIALYYQNQARIRKVIKSIKEGPYRLIEKGTEWSGQSLEKPVSNTTKREFEAMVEQAKEYIRAGDIFQIVLSQRFVIESALSPFQIYRALRIMNPSPYLFYLNFPEVKLIGSSPEVLVKIKDKRVITRPLAGTRRRGNTRAEDIKLEEELKHDEKERAEHIMLVDLGRNDLGRVCEIGSVEVTELMEVEYYSQVMHLVSQVEGNLREGLSSLDVLKAVFPAGTVSGAPKIRAMELIDQLEKEPRGVYAGAVGYIDFKGNLDTCIAIRTFVVKGNKTYIQVGAGIVVDSIPEREYEETLNKARALFRALEFIGRGDSDDLNYRQL